MAGGVKNVANRAAQVARGEYMMSATPTRQMSAPVMSYRSGLHPSTVMPQARDPATKTQFRCPVRKRRALVMSVHHRLVTRRVHHVLVAR